MHVNSSETPTLKIFFTLVLAIVSFVTNSGFNALGSTAQAQSQDQNQGLTQGLNQTQNSRQNSEAGAATIREVYGLDGIDFDRWTRLVSGEGPSEKVTSSVAGAQLQEELKKITQDISSEQQLFAAINKLVQSIQIVSIQDYLELAKQLLVARQDLRQRQNLSSKAKRDSLFLLQIMAEEILYVGSVRAKEFPKEFNLSFERHETGLVGKLRQIRVQSADVALSKATGYGSSSFIALSMSHPHIFSHSTPIYVREDGVIQSPEADTEDGVKLRNMNKDYVQGSKTRLYVYRYWGVTGILIPAAQKALKGMVDEMYERTGGDPENKAAYKYDYSMTPADPLTKGMFCSAVSYEVYKRAGIMGAGNPYPPNRWSPVTKSREKLLSALNMNTDRVPAPGDLEMNPSFQLVGLRLDVSKLQQDRIEMAIVNEFLSYLDANKEMTEQLSESLRKVGYDVVNKESLKKLFASGLLPEKFQVYASKIDSVPDGINYKQLIFFALLNEYLTPKLREMVTAKVVQLQATGKIVGLGELRQLAFESMKDNKAGLAPYIERIKNYTTVSTCSAVLL